MNKYLRVIVNLVEAVIYFGGCFIIALTAFGLIQSSVVSCNLWLPCELGYIILAVLASGLIYIPWACLTMWIANHVRTKI